MNAIFICVIVLVKMCFHMLNLCWFKHKKIFECFKYFWKVLCFYKNWKFSKTVLPCFGDSIAGHPSRMLQPQARVLIWRLVREWKIHSRWVHRDFRGSVRDSLMGRPFNREKHLENFFTILFLNVLVAWPGDLLVTHPSREKRVFGKKWVSF